MEIYGTIGPACEKTELLEQMFLRGMTGVRLNLSHSSLTESGEWMEHIRLAAKSAGVSPQILVDLQGPELRVGKREKNSKKRERILRDGEKIRLSYRGEDAVILPPCVFPHLEKGQKILLDDGKILLEAVGCGEEHAIAKILRGGVLKERKSVALPGVEMLNPTLTNDDLENISCASEYGVTGVMLPFVRNAEDIKNLKQALEDVEASDIRIYAKIENMAGVNALEGLIPHADVIVIARGDLGNAMPLWELPAVQKQISRICKEKQMPFMVVTQMLASMEKAAVPTRAEVSDIYNAVLDGADSVMLTGETAAGSYPVEAMSYLVHTVQQAMKNA